MSNPKLKVPVKSTAAPAQLYGYDASSSAWYPLTVDSSGNMSVKYALEFEITGTPVNIRPFEGSLTGTNTLIAASAAQRIKLYKVFVSPTSDISGTVAIQLGANILAKVINPFYGGNHILLSA